MKEARIATKAEIDRLARTSEARTKSFGKTSDKFAKEAKSRVAAFAKRAGGK